MTQVFAFSRVEAEGVNFLALDYVISITDPGSKPANINASNLLRLSFFDIDGPITTLDGMTYLPMSEEDADKIVMFVRSFPKEMFSIVVHCEAGISRSAGIAAAISEYLYFNSIKFWKNKMPNKYCYELLLRKLNESGIQRRERTWGI